MNNPNLIKGNLYIISRKNGSEFVALWAGDEYFVTPEGGTYLRGDLNVISEAGKCNGFKVEGELVPMFRWHE